MVKGKRKVGYSHLVSFFMALLFYYQARQEAASSRSKLFHHLLMKEVANRRPTTLDQVFHTCSTVEQLTNKQKT